MFRTRDGIDLETDLYAPRAGVTFPTMLIRVPYGLRAFGAAAEAYAERGYIVVIQACRGTSKSGGTFDPLSNERNDGLDTLAWIKQQPWFDGRLGTSGPSYLGYAQWAICDALPKHSAMAIKVTSAEFRSIVYPGGGLPAGLWLCWTQTASCLRGNPMRTAQRMFSGGSQRTTLRRAH